MLIIYCDNVINSKEVEPDYAAEMSAAKSCGFETALLSYEELVEGNLNTAFKHIQPQPTETKAIYRGWMLKPSQYKAMYDHLAAKNIFLVNSPEAFKHSHHLPESYSIIEKYTPKSVWTKGNEHTQLEVIHKLLHDFGNQPVVLKDYVKSEKHHWKEACFIPNPQDKEKVNAVIKKFLELRGDSLNEGLVFRAFVDLEFLTTHAKSGMPLTKEFRLFILDGNVLTHYNYWDEGAYDDETPPIENFLAVAKNVKSRFFTMDIAKKTDHSWIIVELGDGQVAGLPDNANRQHFYEQLAEVVD